MRSRRITRGAKSAATAQASFRAAWRLAGTSGCLRFCDPRASVLFRMAASTPVRSSALRELGLLRQEVRELGATLGRVITRLEGRPTFETVERLRLLAKARRAGDRSAGRKLAT